MSKRSTQMINIGGDENDINYRYKMPPLITKVEGRGNGIKTVLVNVTDVCKHLHTDAKYATRFFGIECGAVSKWDDKRDVGVVHGVHEPTQLQQSLKKFITAFILCPQCRLPELQMKISSKKSSALLIKCASCGHKGENKSHHKVKAYIINHPPKPKRKGGDSDGKPRPKGKDKGSKHSKKDGDNPKKDEIDVKDDTYDENALGGADDEIWSVAIDDEAVALRKINEMKTLVTSNNNENTNEIDNENNNDNKKEGSNNNEMNDKTIENDNETNNNDENEIEKKEDTFIYSLDPMNQIDTSASGPAQVLRSFLNDKQRNIYEILDEIKRLGLAHDLDELGKCKVMLEAVCKFDSLNKFISCLKRNIDLLKQFNRNDQNSKQFFGCIEEIIAKRNPDALLPRTYMILEAIYDAEIATEDQILSWHASETDTALLVERDEAQKVRDSAKPFIKWLQEADEDDSVEDVD